MSESQTKNIEHINKNFTGPTLEEKLNIVHKIPCELGEIYYQTKQNGQVSGGGDNKSNGLFITNDKIQQLINSGEIAKYSWLLELALTGENNFCFGSTTNNLTKIQGKNPSTYYKNGIFIPLTLDSADKDSFSLTFPFGDEYKVELDFNQSTKNKQYDATDIQEAIMYFHKTDYAYGTKQQYSNGETIGKGEFIAKHNGKDVTDEVQMFKSYDEIKAGDCIGNKAVTIGFLPNDFKSEADAIRRWFDDKNDNRPKACQFMMTQDTNGNLKLHASKQDIFEINATKALFKYINIDNIASKTKDNKTIKFNCNKTIGGALRNFQISFTYPDKTLEQPHSLPKFELTNNGTLLAMETADINNAIAQANRALPVLNNKTQLIASYNKLKDTLERTPLTPDVQPDMNFPNVINGRMFDETKLSKNVDNKLYIVNNDDGVLKEVKIFQDPATNKYYYRSYSHGTKMCTGEVKEIKDQAFMSVYTDPTNPINKKTTCYLNKGKNGLFFTEVNKDLHTNANVLLPKVQKYLTYFADNYVEGKTDKTIDQALNGNTDEHTAFTDCATDMDHANFDISFGLVDDEKSKIIYTKDGNIKTANEITCSAGESAEEITNKLKESEKKNIQEEIDNNNANVLSSGALYDFCASQIIGMFKKKTKAKATTQQEATIDPIKAMANEYFRKLALMNPLHSFKFHENKHLKKTINNMGHVNTHLLKKMGKSSGM